MSPSTALTVREASDLAQGLTTENLEAAVAAVDADLVPVYLARLTDAAMNIRALVRGFEQRLVADGLTGAHFTVDGVEYGFYGAQQKGWRDVTGLVQNLVRSGLSLADIGDAISDLRVTSLRAATSRLTDSDAREDALALIEGARFDKGERGAPRFQAIENYVKSVPAK